MSFWDLSDGETAITNEKEYESAGGNFEPIPEGARVIALISSAAWMRDRDGSNERLVVKWSVVEPAEYRNRKIDQKLWVTDDDPNAKSAEAAAKKRDNAKRNLAAIDANSGGKLAKSARKPTDDDLALAMTNKEMAITLRIWEMTGADGQTNSGNWVCAIGPKSLGVKAGDAAPKAKPSPKPAPRPTASGGFGADLDDDVPF